MNFLAIGWKTLRRTKGRGETYT